MLGCKAPSAYVRHSFTSLVTWSDTYLGGTSLNRKGGSGVTLASSKCQVSCVGDTKTKCGGTNAITLYSKHWIGFNWLLWHVLLFRRCCRVDVQNSIVVLIVNLSSISREPEVEILSLIFQFVPEETGFKLVCQEHVALLSDAKVFASCLTPVIDNCLVKSRRRTTHNISVVTDCPWLHSPGNHAVHWHPVPASSPRFGSISSSKIQRRSS